VNYALSDAAVETCGVVEKILSYAAFRQNQELKKTGGKKEQRVKGITKLEDANEAGTNQRQSNSREGSGGCAEFSKAAAMRIAAL
jgi:hypothetical protein